MALDIGSDHDETLDLKEPGEDKRPHRIPANTCSMKATARYSGRLRGFCVLKNSFNRFKRLFKKKVQNKDLIYAPTGKLGEIVHCLKESESASLHDLITLTGWKRATVHSALSRLRAQGHPIKMRKENGAPTYRLEVK